MKIFGLCFSSSVHGVTGHHDLALVALSFIVAVFASFTALEMAERLRSSQGMARRFWRLAAAVALGGGIWSMHFVAMLAFKAPLFQAYDPVLTTLSGLIAIGAVMLGLGVFERPVTAPRDRLGGTSSRPRRGDDALLRHERSARARPGLLSPRPVRPLRADRHRRLDGGVLAGLRPQLGLAPGRRRRGHGGGHLRHALHRHGGHGDRRRPARRPAADRSVLRRTIGLGDRRRRRGHFLPGPGLRLCRSPVRAPGRARRASARGQQRPGRTHRDAHAGAGGNR